jgi:CHAT domain/Ternary complex associated domain 7
MAKLMWSDERILTFDAERSCGELALAIAAEAPAYVVLRRYAGAYHYVFLADEILLELDGAEASLRLDATLDLHEEDSSRRVEVGEYLSDMAPAAPDRRATVGRAVRVEGGRAVAVAETLFESVRIDERGWSGGAVPEIPHFPPISDPGPRPNIPVPHPHIEMPQRDPHAGDAPPDADEGTSIVRHPSLDVIGNVTPAAEIRIRIDLTRLAGPLTAGPPIPLADLPDDWSEMPITARVESSHLSFPDGNEGVVLVRRGQASLAFTLRAEVAAELPPGGEIEIRASFRLRNRFCGEARRLVPVAGQLRAPSPPIPTPSLAIQRDAEGPVLTVNIYRERTMPPDTLFWTIDVDEAYRPLVKIKSAGGVTLAGSADAGRFVQGLFRAAAGCPPGLHVARLQGIGEQLWDMTPDCFRKIYWIVRDAAGDDFPIQFVVDDPWIPWELMRPKRDGVDGLKLLAETHPVGRGFQEYPDQMRPRLPAGGRIVTIAPAYKMRPQLQPLPAALEESLGLQETFAARPLDALAGQLLMVLADTDIGGGASAQPVSILHFAGHGGFDPAQANNSILALDDGDVTVYDVRRQETRLGEKYGTFVILNACEVGATGGVLGTIGGWAEAFAYRRFGGVVAPLWAVDDGHARMAMEMFLGLVLKEKETVGRALMKVRREFGQWAPTYSSYIYYGDVNARFA